MNLEVVCDHPVLVGTVRKYYCKSCGERVYESAIWTRRRLCLECGKIIEPTDSTAYDHHHYDCSREVLKRG